MRACVVFDEVYRVRYLVLLSGYHLGDVAEGGCKDIQCTVLHFQTYRRVDLGTEPTPKTYVV